MNFFFKKCLKEALSDFFSYWHRYIAALYHCLFLFLPVSSCSLCWTLPASTWAPPLALENLAATMTYFLWMISLMEIFTLESRDQYLRFWIIIFKGLGHKDLLQMSDSQSWSHLYLLKFGFQEVCTTEVRICLFSSGEGRTGPLHSQTAKI